MPASFPDRLGGKYLLKYLGLGPDKALFKEIKPADIQVLKAGSKIIFTIGFASILPPSITASVSPASIVRGSSATLSWNTTNTTSVTITPNLGQVAVSGSRSVSPTTTTTYTLTAEGPGGTATTSVVLTVTDPPPTPAATVLVFTIGRLDYTVNGVKNTLDTAPVIIENRTMLPIRYVIEPLGGTILWDNATRKVTITLGTNKIELWINNPVAKVNGKDTFIDSTNAKVVPIIRNNRTLLPLRFVSETLGAEVLWNGTLKTITVKYTVK